MSGMIYVERDFSSNQTTHNQFVLNGLAIQMTWKSHISYKPHSIAHITNEQHTVFIEPAPGSYNKPIHLFVFDIMKSWNFVDSEGETGGHILVIPSYSQEGPCEKILNDIFPEGQKAKRTNYFLFDSIHTKVGLSVLSSQYVIDTLNKDKKTSELLNALVSHSALMLQPKEQETLTSLFKQIQAFAMSWGGSCAQTPAFQFVPKHPVHIGTVPNSRSAILAKGDAYNCP